MKDTLNVNFELRYAFDFSRPLVYSPVAALRMSRRREVTGWAQTRTGQLSWPRTD